jgi:hypothetical protein
MLSKHCIIFRNAANFTQVSGFSSFRIAVFQGRFCKSYKGSPASDEKTLASKMQERVLPQVFNSLLAIPAEDR